MVIIVYLSRDTYISPPFLLLTLRWSFPRTVHLLLLLVTPGPFSYTTSEFYDFPVPHMVLLSQTRPSSYPWTLNPVSPSFTPTSLFDNEVSPEKDETKLGHLGRRVELSLQERR